MTHVPSFVEHTMDHASCPIVAGAPNVLKAAFTKETNFFAVRGIEYVDPACSLIEPNLLRKQLFGAWGERLGVTEDESDHAVADGFRALDKIDEEMQKRGKAILEQVEKEDRVAILMIGRPYHLDPGLNHAIPEEFQILGFPILSIRSIPKDPEWLAKYFGEDIKSGKIKSALDINDVWPENYSANSSQKVWAVKFAAHHPNVALLDLSSFKCGHDAPTYGIIDSIVAAAGTPYSALHDIDANKPGGSIKIRVKTYTHSLGLHKERLDDVAERKAELAHRIDQKRLELLGAKARQLAERQQKDEALEKMIAEVTDRVRAYEAAKRPTISEEAERAADAEALARAGVIKMGIKRAGDETVARI
jgi:predicted nucleotide-binding protein (sugar kinase/HSP70/actin superfamily)